jgi:hypothetical protein
MSSFPPEIQLEVYHGKETMNSLGVHIRETLEERAASRVLAGYVPRAAGHGVSLLLRPTRFKEVFLAFRLRKVST